MYHYIYQDYCASFDDITDMFTNLDDDDDDDDYNVFLLDVNECDNNNGNCQHTCQNLYGRHRCLCRDGYSLDSNEKTCSGKQIL